MAIEFIDNVPFPWNVNYISVSSPLSPHLPSFLLGLTFQGLQTPERSTLTFHMERQLHLCEAPLSPHLCSFLPLGLLSGTSDALRSTARGLRPAKGGTLTFSLGQGRCCSHHYCLKDPPPGVPLLPAPHWGSGSSPQVRTHAAVSRQCIYPVTLPGFWSKPDLGHCTPKQQPRTNPPPRPPPTPLPSCLPSLRPPPPAFRPWSLVACQPAQVLQLHLAQQQRLSFDDALKLFFLQTLSYYEGSSVIFFHKRLYDGIAPRPSSGECPATAGQDLGRMQ